VTIRCRPSGRPLLRIVARALGVVDARTVTLHLAIDATDCHARLMGALKRPEPTGVTLTVLGGCIAGGLLCLAVWPWADGLLDSLGPTNVQAAATLLCYVAGALVVQWIGLAAMQVRYGGVEGLDAGVRRVRLGVALGALAATGFAVAIAAATGFSTAPLAVVVDGSAAATVLAFAIFAGATRWLNDSKPMTMAAH